MAPFQLCLPQIGILKQRTVQISFGSCWDIVHKGLYRCSTRLARHQLKITLEFADIWLSKQVGRLSDDGRPYSNHPDAAAYKVFQALHSSHPYFDALITLPATVSSNYKCKDVSAWKLVCTGPDAKSIYIPLSILPRLHFALFALKC